MAIRRIGNRLQGDHSLEVHTHGFGEPVSTHRIQALPEHRTGQARHAGHALVVMTRNGPFPLKRLLKKPRAAARSLIGRRKSRRHGVDEDAYGFGLDGAEEQEPDHVVDRTDADGSSKQEGGRNHHPADPMRATNSGPRSTQDEGSLLRSYLRDIRQLLGRQSAGDGYVAAVMRRTRQVQAHQGMELGNHGWRDIVQELQACVGPPMACPTMNLLLPLLLLNMHCPRTREQRDAAGARLALLAKAHER